jgi:RNA polymerase sigma-70 factor (ECF subfamily)
MDSLNEQFSSIYDQYIDKIYRFVYLKVNSQEVAEDITSKVFLKGWEAFSAYGRSPEGRQNNEIKNPGAFLYQIARNAVVDHYREKGRARVTSVDDSPQLADPGTSAQDKAILNADISVIRTAMQKLKKDHQDIIIWHYLEDMPIAEIAELVDKPAGTVRVALHRGLKELKSIIQES